MTNWTKLFTDKMDDLFTACSQAQLEAIKAGKIDAVSGQAFQAVNEGLLYADGHIETLRHPGGCIIGDVFVGMAISVAKLWDWTADGFELADDEDPEAIDEYELLADCESDIWDMLDHLCVEMAA